MLAASAGETARILLNSKSESFPDGVANSSGQVGRNLMDTVGAAVSAQFPVLENRPAYNEDGAMGMHVYIPFWLYKEQARGELDFPRSYHYEFGADGRGEPGMGMGHVAAFAGGYGRKLKEDMRRYYGSFLDFVCRGEMIPNADSWCEIDPDNKDTWGIPTLRFHFKWSEHELNMVRHFQAATKEIIERLGGKLQSGDVAPEQAISKGGQIIHEVGTTRMGDDPETSVTNQYGQSWDIGNLFMTDGGVFASKAHKNPDPDDHGARPGAAATTWPNNSGSETCERRRRQRQPDARRPAHDDQVAGGDDGVGARGLRLDGKIPRR